MNKWINLCILIINWINPEDVMGKYGRELQLRDLLIKMKDITDIKKDQIGNENNNFEVLCIGKRKHELSLNP